MPRQTIDDLIFGGSLWDADAQISALAGGASYSYTLIPDTLTSIEAYQILSDSNLTTIVILEGGSHTGGTANTTVTNRNRRTKLTPTFQVLNNTTVVGGTGLSRYQRFASNFSVSQIEGSRALLLHPTQEYHITITNDDTNAHNYAIEFAIDSPALERR